MKHLLFLHGALASKSQFDDIRKTLDASYTTHAFNFSGHGGNLIPIQGLTFPAFAADILKYLDDNKIEKVNLVGFSMGGYAAIYFATKHPDRVEKIFTINTKFKWDPASTAKETGMLDADKMMEKVPSFANNLMVLHGMNMWKNLLKSTSEMMINMAKEYVLTNEDLTAIHQPTMLAIGDRDKTSSLEETLEIYRTMKNPQLLVLPNTAHPFEKIDLDRLAFEIKKFVE